MIRIIYWLTFCFAFSPFYLTAQDALNVELFDQTQREDTRYSGSWSYIAPDGSEYALLGARTGTAIYTIDNQPVTELAFIPGGASNWREITVINDFAYVTTEASDTEGMQIIDLRDLPNSATLAGTFNATFRQGHILQRDIYTDEPYIYINGTRTSQGVHILDISEPANPVEVGVYDPDYYIHDSHIRENRLYACAGNEGVVDIVDISDKTNPILIAQIPNLIGYVHSAWSVGEEYLMVAIETDGLPARMYDISDLDNIEEVARYTANSASLVHNPYLRGDFMFISHNTEGLRVLDVADPAIPVEVGYYDTWSGESGGFSGLWSACPYFPSGKIVGGNRADGLYVWTFNDTRAARIYGTVTDSLTGEIIPRAKFTVVENAETFRADLTGNYGAGFLAGTYTFEVENDGYITKNVTVDLAAGDSLVLNIELASLVNDTEAFIESAELIQLQNPFVNQLNINILNSKLVDGIQLVNAAGQLVVSKKITSTSVEISTVSLAAGVYVLQILNKDQSIISQEKVMKLK
ncbi:MAG: choice-of-anchor B family protein [Saprospiraceae bacterium]